MEYLFNSCGVIIDLYILYKFFEIGFLLGDRYVLLNKKVLKFFLFYQIIIE